MELYIKKCLKDAYNYILNTSKPVKIKDTSVVLINEDLYKFFLSKCNSCDLEKIKLMLDPPLLDTTKYLDVYRKVTHFSNNTFENSTAYRLIGNHYFWFDMSSMTWVPSKIPSKNLKHTLLTPQQATRAYRNFLRKCKRIVDENQ